ncbi:MAG: hypothetical protein CSA11_05070 [Chloroflexi bacterium]|nr:MAG: hypothetical protein CSB13_12120 [Chloroflexota bacterium]PIE81147.1 MAG: hypothetical protein CSA11_05070 [Chloroflexota bacterium]
MPGLARSLEAAGFSTILVSMMPYWAEKIGVPRTLAVEFPFGQTLGQPGNIEQQMRVIRQALSVLAASSAPGTIIHSDEVWPEDPKAACKAWQPLESSPIISELAPQFRDMLRKNKGRK